MAPEDKKRVCCNTLIYMGESGFYLWECNRSAKINRSYCGRCKKLMDRTNRIPPVDSVYLMEEY